MAEAAGAASEWSAVRLFALARLGVEVRSAAELHARLLARVRTCASAVGGLEVWGPRIAGERALAPAMHESVQLFSQWYAAVGQECDQKLSGVEEEGETPATDYFYEKTQFRSTRVSDIMYRPERRETHPNFSLFHTFENMARQRQHRIAG